jgi:hypothetical protein
MLEYGEWTGGKPMGIIFERKGKFQVWPMGHGSGVPSKMFNSRSYGGDVEAARRAAVSFRYEYAKEHGRIRNRWRHVHNPDTGDKFIEVQLTQGKCMIVDIEDLGLVEKHFWSAHASFNDVWYATGAVRVDGSWRRKLLHRLILPDVKIVDHISGDGLDNRRRNLRSVTPIENARNTHVQKNNRSGINGVYERPTFYLVIWREDGKQLNKSFSFKHTSKETAFEEAKAFRHAIDARLGFTIRPRKRPRESEEGADAEAGAEPETKRARVEGEEKEEKKTEA